MKLVTIVGARPQFIKAAMLSKTVQKNSGFSEVLIHTGQHFDENMSGYFFRDLEMEKPKYNLKIQADLHGAMTGRMLESIEQILLQEKPDAVVVYGDTNSTLAGALAASKLHIPIAHVEAGLRSYSRKMPEEQNRVLTDHLSKWLFVPSAQAEQNLKLEGILDHSLDRRVLVTGDIMFDAAIYFGKKAQQVSSILSQHALVPKKYILATIHRAENTDNVDRLMAIFNGLSRLSSEIKIILPLHPRTKKKLEKNPNLNFSDNLKIIDPVGYLDMVMLEKNAALIASDSGGVQKEAFFYQVPCVTLRDETEWTELVDSGWNYILPPTDAEKIYNEVLKRIGTEGRKVDLYGSGNAAEKMIQALSLINI